LDNGRELQGGEEEYTEVFSKPLMSLMVILTVIFIILYIVQNIFFPASAFNTTPYEHWCTDMNQTVERIDQFMITCNNSHILMNEYKIFMSNRAINISSKDNRKKGEENVGRRN